MTDIPTYDTNQVRLRPIDNTRRTGPSDVGQTAPGRALQGLGKTLEGAAAQVDRLMEIKAETRAREVDVEASQFALAKTTELASLKGLAYDAAAPRVIKEIEDHGRELGSRATNDFERRMIRDTVQRRVMAATATIGQQRVREVEFAHKAQAGAVVENNAVLAFTAYGQPEWKTAKAALIGAVRDELAINGVSDPDSRIAAERKVLTGVHTAGITAALDRKDFAVAEEMLADAEKNGELDVASIVALRDRHRDVKNDYVDKQMAMDVITEDGIIDEGGPEYAPPVAGKVQVTSDYGPRSAPRAGASTFHRGQDIAVPVGTPVQAMADGVIVFNGARGNYGNQVVVDHGGGHQTTYSHLQGSDLKVGAKVKAGSKIALSGATGNVTGPHLHVEVHQDGKAVDPKNARTILAVTQENRAKVARKLADGDPERFATIYSALGTRLAQQEAIKNKRKEETYDAIYGEIDAGRMPAPSLIARLTDPKDRLAVKDYLKRREEDVDVEPEVNMETYGDLETMAATNPRGFMAPGYLETKRATLTKGQYTSFLRVREQYRNGQFPSSSQEETNRAAELASEGLKDDDKRKFKGAVWSTIRELESRGDKKQLTDEERLAVATRLRTQVKSGWWTQTPAFELAPGVLAKPKDITATYKRIPEAARLSLVQAYKAKHGKLPTQDMVVEQYLLKLARGD